VCLSCLQELGCSYPLDLAYSSGFASTAVKTIVAA